MRKLVFGIAIGILIGSSLQLGEPLASDPCGRSSPFALGSDGNTHFLDRRGNVFGSTKSLEPDRERFDGRFFEGR